MLFNSYPFIFIFLPIVFFGYYYLASLRLILASRAFLVGSSLFFYSWWNIVFLPYLLFSLIFNYSIASAFTDYDKKYVFLKKYVSKKSLLVFGLVVNIAFLSYFKYADFFIKNINFITASHFNLLKIALPLGISFITFQKIAYLVDSYQGKAKTHDFLSFSLFVTFFPQLIAGPIVHHSEMMPQFISRWNWIIKYRNITIGIFIFSIGLFKKVLIADMFGVWANNGYAHTANLALFEAWATSLSYTFQLYFDFSGYSDMAVGLAYLFNIKLPFNFNSPYKATNIQDFWKRWHITLSRFLKAYVYIPLGGNKAGYIRTYLNLFITFLIGGIWHGAGWTFVLWGILHGVAIIIHRVWQSLGIKLNSLLAWFITFNFINLTWIFFRGKNLEDTMNVIKGMLGAGGVIFPAGLAVKFGFLNDYGAQFGDWLSTGDSKEEIIYIIFGFLSVLLLKNSMELTDKFKPKIGTMLLGVICLSLSFVKLNSFRVTNEFLYFNF